MALRRGFTLVELLVVIAIIGILVGLLLPAVQAAREAGRRSQCSNNLKQIGLALQNYHAANSALPFGSNCCNASGTGTSGTWAYGILPFLDEQSTFDLFDFRSPLWAAANAPAVTTLVSTFVCPSDPDAVLPIMHNRPQVAWNNPSDVLGLWYPGSIGPTEPDVCPFCPNPSSSSSNPCCQGCNFGTTDVCGLGVGPGNSVGLFGRFVRAFRFREVTDGLSHTLMSGETIPSHCVWNGAYNGNFPVYPTTIPINTLVSDGGTGGNYYTTCGFKSYHPGGALFVMGDGSVHFLDEAIDYILFNNLGTRAGGEFVGVPE